MESSAFMGVERKIQEVVERLVDAWNRQDWRSFSRLFAEDADYVTGAGIRLAGRAQIYDGLRARATSSLASMQVSLAADSVKLLGPDIAVVLCSWKTTAQSSRPGDGSGGRAGLLTMVLQSARGGWQIMALHNTDRTG